MEWFEVFGIDGFFEQVEEELGGRRKRETGSVVPAIPFSGNLASQSLFIPPLCQVELKKVRRQNVVLPFNPEEAACT